MECHKNCGECCIILSISSPIPGMPNGKPSGVRCVHLLEDRKCALFGDPSRPRVCHDFLAEPLFCGESAKEAKKILSSLL